MQCLHALSPFPSLTLTAMQTRIRILSPAPAADIRSSRRTIARAGVLGLAAAVAAVACGGGRSRGAGTGATADSTRMAAACPSSGLTLPAGFCASVFADSVGHARHIAVAANGDVYVNTRTERSGPEASAEPVRASLVAMRDTDRDGGADIVIHFGPGPAPGAAAARSSSASEGATGHGGTGIALHGGYLYAEDGSRIVRYKMRPGELTPDTVAEVIVRDMPMTGDHPMHPFIIDSSGALYVDMGSATNSCQLRNRTLRSPGHRPCTELETRAGIWKFDAGKTGQRFSRSARWATGLRNAEGYAINPADGQLYATQHGRDQLAENWPKRYQQAQGAELPAEELVRVVHGGDYGWPYCYFDGGQAKLVLAPEYGGNGTTVGQCAAKRAPVGWYPAHWAPDDLLFYTGTQFPARYRGGAFIAFHGSWNRAPLPQGGYNVTFVPWSAHPDSAHETFADGFAGAVKQPDQAAHRPAGLAEGPDGAIYITDDQHGRVWRVWYGGASRGTGTSATGQ